MFYMDGSGAFAAKLGSFKQLLPAFVGIVCACIIWVVAFLLRRRRGKSLKTIPVHTIFLFSSVAFGLLSCLIFLPGSIPDENGHIQSCYLWYNRILGIPSKVVETDEKLVYRSYETYMRADDAALLSLTRDDAKALNKDGYREYVKQFKLFCSKEEAALVPATLYSMTVSPVVYLPAILAFLIARFLRLSFVPMLYLGRIFMLGFYVLCGWWAIRRVPVRKSILYVCASLPMAIHLSASFSYDSVILALSFVLVAELIRWVWGNEERISWQRILFVAIVAFLLAPCKVMSYLPILLLIFAVPKQRFAGRISRTGAFLIAFAAGILGVCIVNASTILHTVAEGSIPGQSAYGARYAIASLLENPANTFGTILNTLYVKSGWFIQSMVGAYLGSLDISVSASIINLFVFVLLLACIPESQEQVPLRPKKSVFYYLLAPTLCYLFFSFGLLLWETPLGSNVVYGLQGRYFLPMLPLVCYALSYNRLSAPEGMWKRIVFGTAFLNGFAFMCATMQIARLL